jgi:hypothetical protein
MTEAEALDMVRRTISGTVVTFPHPLVDREETFLIGDKNADAIVRALHSAGWSWVPRLGSLSQPPPMEPGP